MSFRVAKERCDQCLFSENRIVSGSRMAEILADCRRRDAHFVCHKFTIAEGEDSQVCCRGFIETQPATQLMRIADRLGVIEDAEVPNV